VPEDAYKAACTDPVLPTTSSVPAEVPEEQESLFREVLALLEEKRVPYAVSGAFALRHHTGICRFTKDLDIFVTAEASAVALGCLREAGYECEIRDPVWLAKAHKDGFFVDLITGMSNGVIVVEDSWIERAQPAVIHGVRTRVLGAEELVASKLFVAKRERFDGADIAHVIYGTREKFDWMREMDLVGENWEILFWSLVLFQYVYPAHSDYVPDWVWHELLQRFCKAITQGDPRPRFRGSLVDENMFAIDVNEWGLDNILEETRAKRLSQMKGWLDPRDGGRQREREQRP
jgi:predicted nucleotidyltransferase